MLIRKLVDTVRKEKEQIPDDLLSKALHKYDNIPQVIRTPQTKESYIHSSSLPDFCARRAAILIEESRQPKEYVNGGNKIVWAMGRAVESHIRTALIESLGKHRFFGLWKCKCGTTSHEGRYSSSRTCPICKTSLYEYNELTLLDEELRISGNPDLIFITDEKALMPIEIKSIKKGAESEGDKSFMGLKDPSTNYAKQLCRYSYLLKRQGHKVSSVGKIIYACKEYMFKTPYKEFSIEVNKPEYLASFNEEVEQLLEFNKYRDTDKLPERVFCKSMFSKLAKDCPACNTCFGGEG